MTLTRQLVATALVAWFALLSSAGEAQANALESTRIALPRGPASIEGLGRSPSTSPATGSARYGIDIAVPPAAGGFAPRLSIEYDSATGTSELGLGFRWGGLPLLRRRVSEGLPRFDASDGFELSGLGVDGELILGSGGFFRPRVETGSFVRVERLSADLWEARSKEGVSYRLGGPGCVEEEEGHVVSYLPCEQRDLHGHVISYRWDVDHGVGLLASIVWNDFSPAVRQTLEFEYEARPDRHELFSSGIRQLHTRRLSAVRVTLGGEMVRRYELGYSERGISRLTSVRLVGADGKTALPAVVLGYSELDLGQATVRRLSQAPTRYPDEQSDLVDMNGDGLPDLLVGETGRYRCYLNRGDDGFEAADEWEASKTPSVGLAQGSVELVDVDGDGASDLLIQEGETSARYLPGLDSHQFGPSVVLERGPSLRLDAEDVRFADMDGDRRADLVRLGPSGLAISYNQGGHGFSAVVDSGALDPARQPSFAGDQTALCEVNGDGIFDLCTLRSGSLRYYLGRGRGRFEASRIGEGVPTFPANERWRLLDLNGDGWTDLVHVGTGEVRYALAEGAARFGAVQHLAGPSGFGTSPRVELADLNGSGTLDIVWMDASASSGDAWRYLELFPSGRAGLLTDVDNGLGGRVHIDYQPASELAALARKAGRPWAGRSNLAVPVVSAVTVDDSLGGLPRISRYEYADGAWDPSERSWAGFAKVRRTDEGDVHTPSLVTETHYDTGLVHRALRGAELSRERRDQSGRVFDRLRLEYELVSVAESVLGRTSDYAYVRSRRLELLEGEEKGRSLLWEGERDVYGNLVEERDFGEVEGEAPKPSGDETFTHRTFAVDSARWILDFLASEEVTNAAGYKVSARRLRYDGAPFVGLEPGRVERGDVARIEAWIGPGPDDFELEQASRYDADGNVLERRDGAGGARLFSWDKEDHTSLTRERVASDGPVELYESVELGRAHGQPLTVVEYNGAVHRFEYDALGRLVRQWQPGDPPGAPSSQHRYRVKAPLSSVETVRRVFGEGGPVEQSVTWIDGTGRKRGSLARDGDRWVLADVALLDRRGQPWRRLRPRFVDAAAANLPPVTLDAPGWSLEHDALGREIGTTTELGHRTRTLYRPLVVERWDAGQLDPSAGFDGTPEVERQDGQGRVVAITRQLEGHSLSARFGYDAAGRLVSRADAEGHVSRYEYDGRGRRVGIEDPDAGRLEQRFDARGLLIEKRRAGRPAISYRRDRLGRLSSEDHDGDGLADVEYTWDVAPDGAPDPLFAGKLAQVQDRSGLRRFLYDERGRLVSTSFEWQGNVFETQSRFDNLGREYLHVYPDGSSVRLERNARGQLEGYGDALRLEFAGDGLETKRRFNTGVTRTSEYDGDRRLIELGAKDRDGHVIQRLGWRLDAAGNVRELKDLGAAAEGEAGRSEQYGYDNLYRLRSARGAWGTVEFDYSASGNLWSRRSNVAELRAERVEYGASHPHGPVLVGERKLEYDAWGRLERDGRRSFGWNGLDQLEKVEELDGGSVRNVFDYRGERAVRIETDANGEQSTTLFLDAWSEVRDGRLVRYLVHGDQRVARLADDNGVPSAFEFRGPTPPGWLALLAVAVVGALGGALRKRALRAALGSLGLAVLVSFGCLGCSGPAEFTEQGTIVELSEADTLLFTDQLGSLVAETDGLGRPQASFENYPFGVARSDTSKESRKFAGATRDESVSLDYMGARFYAPDLGIWTAPDPLAFEEPESLVIGEFGAANSYAYANLSPTLAIDEDGHFWHIVVGAAVGGVLGGAREALAQYSRDGRVSDWGRVGMSTLGGVATGAIVAAMPTIRFLGPEISSGIGYAVGGLVGRAIASKGKDLGTVGDVLLDFGQGVGRSLKSSARGASPTAGAGGAGTPRTGASSGSARPAGSSGGAPRPTAVEPAPVAPAPPAAPAPPTALPRAAPTSAGAGRDMASLAVSRI